MEDMGAGLVVPGLYHMGKDVHHGAVDLLPLIDLLLHQVDQVLLPGVKHQGIGNTPPDHRQIEGTADVIRGTHVVGPADKAGVIFRGNDNNGDLVNTMPLFHELQNAEAVHFRHIDVQHDEVDVRVLLHQLHGLHAVFRHAVHIGIPQNVGQDLPVHIGIVRNEDLWFLIHSSPILLPASKGSGYAAAASASLIQELHFK